MDDLDPGVTAAVVAGAVSAVGALVSYMSAKSTVRRQLQQTQLGTVIGKRVELYPQLWQIHIKYETNWTLENKSKSQQWARDYVDELNAFNLLAGVFFSEALYRRFHELRTALYQAIETTEAGTSVSTMQTESISRIVYGEKGHPGLSTIEKDDLGSYRSVELQRRRD
jgi:hypothetical protein